MRRRLNISASVCGLSSASGSYGISVVPASLPLYLASSFIEAGPSCNSRMYLKVAFPPKIALKGFASNRIFLQSTSQGRTPSGFTSSHVSKFVLRPSYCNGLLTFATPLWRGPCSAIEKYIIKSAAPNIEKLDLDFPCRLIGSYGIEVYIFSLFHCLGQAQRGEQLHTFFTSQ